MNKQFFHTLAVIISFFSVNEIKAGEYLTLHFKSGVKISFPTNDNPQIRIEDNTLSISTEHFLISNITKYTIGQTDYNDIENIRKERNIRIYPTKTYDLIYISSPENLPIKIFSTDGIEYNVPLRRSDNLTILNLSGLKNNIYLLQIDKETVKIIKK